MFGAAAVKGEGLSAFGVCRETGRMEEGKRAEEKAAAVATGAAPLVAGADASAAANGEGGGVEEEVEGEDDGEVGPKVSRDKLSRALSAPRTPYAKPQGEALHVMCFCFVAVLLFLKRPSNLGWRWKGVR